MDSTTTDKIIISETELQERIAELGKQISEDYAGKHPVIVSILKGAFYFVADLTRQITIPVNIDFMSIGIYPGVTNQSGIVKITKDLDISITGRHVILVEDIVRTGLTLGYIVQHLTALKPASVQICTLLDDSSSRLITIPVKYIGFTAPKSFIVGYGLDYNEDYRHLRYIAEFEKTD